MLIDSPHLKYGSPQAAAAEYIWQKRNEIEAKKTILLAYSNMGEHANKEKLSEVAKELIEDMLPFIKKDREQKTKRMEQQLEEAVGEVMQVTVPTETLMKTRKLVPKHNRIRRTVR